MSGEGDLDPTEGHSQLSVGTLPLTDKDPPEDPEDESSPQDQPETPIDPGEHPAKPPSKRSQKNPVADPFSRFWSGETADVTDKDNKELPSPVKGLLTCSSLWMLQETHLH